MGMAEYVRKLMAAAHIILSGDEDWKDEDTHRVDVEAWGVSGTLKPHQVEGISWLIRRYQQGVNVILGDEMGLGKTLQAICFLSYLKFQQKRPGPFLILCPLSVTDGWMSEFTTFSSNLKIMRYVGDKVLRYGLRKEMLEHVKKQCSKGDPTLPFDALLTTYDIAILDQEFLSQVPWCYAIIDEAQRLKNTSSVLYNVLEGQFILPRRLLLTGTPIQNNISELWALLHFCMPFLFQELDEFVEAFKEAGGPVSDCSAGKTTSHFGALKYILKAFLLRRAKSMLVESGTLLLPPLTEITVLVPLVQLQKRVYVSILRRELPKILVSSSGGPSQHALQNIVIQLRKACSHPYLFSGIEPEPFSEGEHLVVASGKLIVLDKLLQKLHAGNHRVLLFAQMTRTLDILQDFMELRRYTYERLDGSVRAEERFAAIRSFSEQPVNRSFDSHLGQGDAFVFMISTRAGGVGLNLVASDTVIFYEQDWNPQVDKQALQRAHRIGQNKHVLSINLITSGTVEEVIMRRAASKLQLSQNVIGGDYVPYNGDNEASVENADLKSSIFFGLDKFDPVNVLEEDFSDGHISEADSLAETVLQARLRASTKRVDQSYVDDSGIWGRGGMFDALSNLSSVVPDLYKKALECSDLHLGDLHFVRVDGTDARGEDNAVGDGPQWVALAVVQSYNPRRKVPRSKISVPNLEKCIRKACFSAARLSASIHMPRIGYGDGSERTEWYTVERLLRKHASAYGVKIFVYYFRRVA